jgi:hypothetical protein
MFIFSIWRVENAIFKRQILPQHIVCSKRLNIFFGIRKIYKAHLSPNLIIAEILFEVLSFYLNAHYVSKAFTNILASGVNFQNRYDHRNAS